VGDEIRNVFVSHIHEDDADIPALKKLAGDAGLQVRDGSINSLNPNNAHSEDYIKSSILAPQIRWASVLVVLISADTHNSPWVAWEVEYAQKLGKRIVGIWAHGAQDSDLPQSLDDYASAVVGWHGDSIKDAICGANDNWENSSGEPRMPRAIARHNC
jgi:hypothetical protein